jgi:large subunit ribosomal protein L25
MAIQLKINAQPRTEAGRNAVKKIKRAGFVPGVIYGAKDPALNIQVAERELAKLLDRASSESVLVDVQIQDGADTRNRTALIQEIQHHPVSGRIQHLDLHAVAMDELLTAEVNVETLGEAIGVRQGGGVLELILRTLEIECLPADLPESITVDVSALEIGDSIHVKTLALPSGVTVLNDGDLTVVSVAAPTVVEEPAAALPEAGAQPEVLSEKKPDAAATPAAS